jgi:hypothetical protein
VRLHRISQYSLQFAKMPSCPGSMTQNYGSVSGRADKYIHTIAEIEAASEALLVLPPHSSRCLVVQYPKFDVSAEVKINSSSLQLLWGALDESRRVICANMEELATTAAPISTFPADAALSLRKGRVLFTQKSDSVNSLAKQESLPSSTIRSVGTVVPPLLVSTYIDLDRNSPLTCAILSEVPKVQLATSLLQSTQVHQRRLSHLLSPRYSLVGCSNNKDRYHCLEPRIPEYTIAVGQFYDVQLNISMPKGVNAAEKASDNCVEIELALVVVNAQVPVVHRSEQNAARRSAVGGIPDEKSADSSRTEVRIAPLHTTSSCVFNGKAYCRYSLKSSIGEESAAVTHSVRLCFSEVGLFTFTPLVRWITEAQNLSDGDTLSDTWWTELNACMYLIVA